jgi:flagellar basal-body rod protein FlgC
MNLIPGANSASQGLRAEQVRLEIISQNIANARTTKTADGGPYQRQSVRFKAALGDAMAAQSSSSAKNEPTLEIVRDPRPAVRVYQPGHPDSDKEGFVAYPAINIHEEMADLISANRSYEANIAVMRNGRALAQQALSIGKR